MTTIIGYIRSWLTGIDKKVLLITSLFTAALVFLNYFYFLDSYISARDSFLSRFLLRYLIFFLAFVIPYLLFRFIAGKSYPSNPSFAGLLFFAPALFSLKTSLNVDIAIEGENLKAYYWNYVLYWPLLLVLISFFPWLIWRRSNNTGPFYGLTIRNLDLRPYLLMLLIMVPLVALASTQPDFLAVYPKLRAVTGLYDSLNAWEKLLFELSYGSDFFSIELFFRGFLILAFLKWAGKDAVLPMACFYCTIHFGKPLGECISSYFGGLFLGIIVYNTRSIIGGLIVHLGIAWLMELGGYIGNSYAP